MNLLDRYIDFISGHQLFTTSDRLLVAVSGGTDSTVLCDLCAKAGFSFSMAHANFRLRGAESERDEAFVTNLAKNYSVPCYVKQFDTRGFAEAHKLSIQEAARKLRYDWFNQFVSRQSSDPHSMEADEQTGENSPVRTYHYILTAHHLNDNVETVMMNFFKGTGISGLRGIRPKSGKIVRPLLFAKKTELEQYAEENQLTWVHDSSNDETKYTRNFFRRVVLPDLEKVFPEASDNIAHNIQRFGEVEMLYEEAIGTHKKKLLQIKEGEVHIPVLKLLKSKPLHTIMYEISKEYGFSNHQTGDLIHLLNSESGKYVSSSTHRVLRNREWLIISPVTSGESKTVLIEEGDKKAVFDDKTINIRSITQNIQITTDPDTVVLDARNIRFPLLLRKWKQGDYFYPLGMRKKKKLSRFFIDQKLSRTEKENVWVIESNKMIVWVVGHRIDDRFKIIPSTKKAIQFQVNKQ